MKKMLIICSLAVFFPGCILVSSEKKELSKEPVPKKVVAKSSGSAGMSVARAPASRQPARSQLRIDISCKDENNHISHYGWTEIYLDDNFISSTSSMQLYLEPGQHKITVKTPGYKTYEKTITILPGRTMQTLNILLEKE